MKTLDKDSELKKLKEFIALFKTENGIYIPQSQFSDLANILIDSTNMFVSFKESDSLSSMETLIMCLIAIGLANDKISRVIGVSVNTIKTYILRVRTKLGAKNKQDAVIKCFRLGIIKIIS